MKHIYGERGCGKTTRIIQYADKIDAAILTFSRLEKEFLQKRVKELGAEVDVLVYPMEAERIAGKKIVIDEALLFLQQLISKEYGALNAVSYTIGDE